ncbi:Unc-5 C [Mactra antiquata]
MDHTPLEVGLVVLGVVILLMIIAGVLVIWFILAKLRLHENDILKLNEDRSTGAYINTHGHFRDSAIEIDERVSSSASNGHPPSFSNGSSSSTVLTTQSKLSLIVKDKEYRVYAQSPPYGQILMTAQNYHKSTTCSDTVVPTEEVQVVDKVSNIPKAISKMLAKDWMEGLPTSLLFNGDSKSFENMFSFNKGVFIHRTIGKEGGSLEVSGVTLIIPPEALEDDTLITVGIIWDKRHTPNLTRKQAMLSPVVLCQPSRLRFKVPVTLKFPHCAQRIKKDWIPQVLKREGALSEEHSWESVTLADYDERDITDTHISLKLHHFTLYALVGTSQHGKTAAKLVHIVAFAGKLQKDSFFKPRLFCLDRYKEKLEEVEVLTKKLDASSKMVDTTDLLIHDNGEDVMLEINKLSDDWNLQTDMKEVLPFEQVWHSFHPHCTMVIKPKTTNVSEIMCEIHAYQNGEDNNKAKLRIAEQVQQSISPLSSPEDDPVEGLKRQLIILLDPVNSVGTDSGDWRDLASKMGCEISKIRWLGVQSSPTRILLDKWFEDKQDLLDLEQIMIDVNRPDAAEEVRTVINKLNHTQTHKKVVNSTSLNLDSS